MNYATKEHYLTFTTRLHKALIPCSSKLASTTEISRRLYDCVLDHFDRDDFEYGYSLINPEPKQWFSITEGDPLTTESGNDRVQASPSLTEALASLLTTLDAVMQFPTHICADEQKIELLVNGALLARIEPIIFQPHDLEAKHRVEKTLKGIRKHFDQRGVVRLSSIPSLESIKAHNPQDRPALGSMAIKTASNLSLLLREMISTHFEIEIKQHQAQDVIAFAFGAKNWAAFVAKEDEHGSLGLPVMLTSAAAKNAEDVNDKRAYYHTFAEGIWGYAQALRRDECYSAMDTFFEGYTPYLYSHTAGNTCLTELPVMSLGHLPYAGYGEENLLRAKGLLASNDLVQSIANHFSVQQHSVADPSMVKTQIERVMQRQGVSSEAWIMLGDWVYWIKGEGTEELLRAAQFDSTGKLRLRRSTIMHKAKLGIDPETASVAVLGDYGSRVDFSLVDLNEEQIGIFMEFTGLRTPWLRTPAQHIKPDYSDAIH